MKRRKQRRLMTRMAGLFFAVLLTVLCAGTAMMYLYSLDKAEVMKEERGAQTVVSEDIFQLPQESAENSTPVQEAQKEEELSEDERLFQESEEAGEKALLVKTAEEGSVKLLFAGDILFDEHYAIMANLRDRGGNIEEAFSQELLTTMRAADIFMLNNEFPFTDRGVPTQGKTFTFRVKPERVSLLHDMGVDVVALANNHAYDYGEISLLDTLDTLNAAGIFYTGAGRNLEEAAKPVYLIANGMKIGIISATQIERNSVPDTKEATENTPGVFRCMDSEKLAQVLRQMEERCDYTILYIHWGTENQEAVDWLQEKQAPLYAEAGADLIIGDHPHCLQKMDNVSGVPVIYSLGNFLFNSKTLDTGVVEIVLAEKELRSFRFLPCKQEDSRTRQLAGAERQDVLNYMRGISPNVTIDEEGYVDFH